MGNLRSGISVQSPVILVWFADGAPDVGDLQREKRKEHLVPGGTAEALLPVSRRSGGSLGHPAGACKKGEMVLETGKW